MGDDALNARLEALSRRLEEVERRLGIGVPGEAGRGGADAAPTEVARIIENLEMGEAEASRWVGLHAVVQRVREEGVEERGVVGASVGDGAGSVVATAVGVMPVSVGEAAREKTGEVRIKTASAKRDLEQLIGGKWYAWMGALILVVGVGLGLKWAYDEGLLRVAPMWRCIWAGMFGAALVVAGEFLRKRINVLAAVGAYAAGVGTMYASVFAAYRLFDLISLVWAFVMLAGTAVLGVVVGSRTRLVSVAALSLIAGYITPFVFSDAPERPLVLPAYLLMLLGTGLVLTARLGARFVLLRSLVWYGTVIFGGLWAFEHATSHGAWACAFLAIAWAAVHAELCVSTRGDGLTAAEAKGRSASGAEWRAARPLISSFSTSAWAVSLAVYVLRECGSAPDWLAPAAGMCGAMMMGVILVGHLRVMFETPRTDAERLGAWMWVQASGLLVATVFVAFSGHAQVLCWLTLGIAASAAGRRLNARAFSVYGVVALSIAAARLIGWDSWRVPPGAWSVPFGGLVITTWTLLAAACGAAWIATGVLWRSREDGRGPVVCAAIGVAMLFVSLISGESRAFSIAVAWLLLAVAVIAASGLLKRLRLDVIGMVALGLTTAVTGVAFVIDMIAEGNVQRTVGLVLSQWPVLVMVYGAAWIVLGTALRWKGRMAGLTTGAVNGGIGLVFMALAHFEASREAVCVAWLAMTGAIAAVQIAWPRIGVQAAVIGGVVFTTLAWALAYPGMGWSATSWSAAAHPGLLVAVAIGGMGLVAARVVRGWESCGAPVREAARPAGTVFCACMVFIASSYEVSRIAARVAADPAARGAAISIWWGLWGFAMIIMGFARRIGPVRQVGLALLGVSAGKAIILDLASVPTIWRVGSFIGLGILMITVTAVYQRAGKKLVGEGER